MQIFYTDHFELPLPTGHRFPMVKYRQLRANVVQNDAHINDVLIVPSPVSDDQLALCHTRRYIDAVVDGQLTSAEIRRIGFPWSKKMVERSRRSTGATIAAARAALQQNVAVNLAGGTHHAMRDAGEGYCVFNDSAVAIRVLQQSGEIKRACVIDLDVHQGNGTAEIFQGDDSVFTLSIHGEKNFPLRKTASSLDVSLRDGTGDQAYLDSLHLALAQVKRAGPFDLAIYLAGADPFKHDRLGRLSLSMDGLARRDRMVLQWCQEQGVSVAVAMAGGYANDVDDIVKIHSRTVQSAGQFAASRLHETDG